LAHGFTTPTVNEGIFVLVVMTIVMTIYLFWLLMYKIFATIPKGLFISSLISYILVSICVLDYYFKLPIPKIIGESCDAAVFYPNFITLLIFWSANSSTGCFISAFIVETLVIFGLIRLVLYIKHKISPKKPQIKQAV
jgi:hypothetical protein